MEKIRIVALDAGMQIGERKGLDIVGAALEIQRQRIRHRARNQVSGNGDAAIVVQHRFAALGTRRQLQRHRGNPFTLALERQRHPAHHVIGVGDDIERTDILLPANRDLLALRRPLAAENFTQHHLAGTGSARKRAQEIAVEATHSRSQQIIAKGNLG
jgi:hypothetical protein